MKIEEILPPLLDKPWPFVSVVTMQVNQDANFHSELTRDSWKRIDEYSRTYGLACARAAAVAVLDEAITRALEWSASRNPENGGYALRNYADDIRRLRDKIAKGESE